MGNFDLPTSEYRGASMSYRTTLISEKRQRCDSPEDTQLVNVGLTLRTLESQWPPHPSVCCKPESSFECNCIQWYLNVYCLTFLVICGGYQFSSVQSLSRVRLFVAPWTAARQASPSITNSQSLLKPMSIESVMPSSHLILCHPLLLPPSIFPSIRVFPNESVLHIRQPKCWSFNLSISPSNI